MKIILLFVAFSELFLPSFAQDTSAISTANDVYHFASTRPSFSEGILLVPKRKAQVELGASYSNYAKLHEIKHPVFLLKYGISEYFELRINGDATTYKYPDSSATGLHPIFIGMKIKMIDAKKYAPGSSFIGGLSTSFISTKNFRTKYVAPYFRIVMEQFLPKNIGLIYNYGLIWNGEDALPTYTFSIASNYTHLLTTDNKHQQLKVFLEFYGIYPHGKQLDLRVNTGLAYLLNKWLQFDISVGAGCTKSAPRVTTNMGLSMRFPNALKQKKKS